MTHPELFEAGVLEELQRLGVGQVRPLPLVPVLVPAPNPLFEPNQKIASRIS